ncbi:hypothetical protein ACERII_23295 [Evansella sp. AB-rgal1]|uniref:hypothetical protein n=1 Tax=Evansella sp. AB-rgal1 TaxID=3242696 RepID=UPI00359D772E
MVYRIHAYFKSENDAEAAKATIQQLHVSHVLVDSIPEKKEKSFILPPLNYSTADSLAPARAPAKAYMLLNVNKDDSRLSLTHVLEFQVEEDDLDKALEQLRSNKAYIDVNIEELIPN